MNNMNKSEIKNRFLGQLQDFVADLNSYVATDDGQWTVRRTNVWEIRIADETQTRAALAD